MNSVVCSKYLEQKKEKADLAKQKLFSLVSKVSLTQKRLEINISALLPGCLINLGHRSL